MEEKTIKLDEKVTVRSIAQWTTGAKRVLSNGDIQIQPNGTVSISREEILAQARNGNKLITGIDGYGSHATLYIEDEWVRRELEFDTDEKKQVFVDAKLIKSIYEAKTFNAFKKKIEENIVTRAEKVLLIETIKAQKFNDYERNVFCETYCGYKLR